MADSLKYVPQKKLSQKVTSTVYFRMCHLEGETEEPHAMNQSILYNHGML